MKRTDEIILGDAIAGMRQSPAGSVQLIVADPPYNIGYEYDVYDDRKSREEYLSWSRDWISAAAELLADTGALWIAIGDEYAAELKQLGDAAGLTLRNWVVWYYTFGVRCAHKFSRSHTHFLYFVKNEKRHKFRSEKILVPSARQLVYGDKRANAAGKLPDNTWILRPQDAAGAFHPVDDTWYFARVAGTFKERAGFHGCQLPEQLLGRIIQACSDPGDLVVDPFAGSGSTLIVAKKLGRRWCGWELSESYRDQAIARLEAVEPGDPLEGPADPLSSAPTTARGRSLRPKERLDDAMLVDAFCESHEGRSIRDVLADPVRAAALGESCRRRGLTGRPSQWNARLLEIFDRREVLGLPPTQDSPIERESLDEWLDASEMAFRLMLDAGYRDLDAILCDPWAASQFDELASAVAPGHTAQEYRLAARQLEREANDRDAVSGEGLAWIETFEYEEPVTLDRCDLSSIDRGGLVYELIANKTQTVYVGETARGRDRLRRLFDQIHALDRHVVRKGPWRIRTMSVPDLSARLGLQSLRIARATPRPRLNFLDLAVERSEQPT